MALFRRLLKNHIFHFKCTADFPLLKSDQVLIRIPDGKHIGLGYACIVFASGRGRRDSDDMSGLRDCQFPGIFTAFHNGRDIPDIRIIIHCRVFHAVCDVLRLQRITYHREVIGIVSLPVKINRVRLRFFRKLQLRLRPLNTHFGTGYYLRFVIVIPLHFDAYLIYACVTGPGPVLLCPFGPFFGLRLVSQSADHKRDSVAVLKSDDLIQQFLILPVIYKAAAHSGCQPPDIHRIDYCLDFFLICLVVLSLHFDIDLIFPCILDCRHFHRIDAVIDKAHVRIRPVFPVSAGDTVPGLQPGEGQGGMFPFVIVRLTGNYPHIPENCLLDNGLQFSRRKGLIPLS